jgi:cyanophycinase
MQSWLRISSLLAAVLALTAITSLRSEAQERPTDAYVRPIEGSRMVVGDGEAPDYLLDCFLHLCRDASPNVVVICLDGTARIAESRWKARGAGSVHLLDAIPDSSEALTIRLLAADGVWIDGKPDELKKHPLVLALLKNVTARNRVIAVGASSAPLLESLDETSVTNERIQSVFAKCKFHFGKGQSGEFDISDRNSLDIVHWSIPNSSALIVHGERRLTCYGEEDVRMLVQAAGGWPVRRGSIESIDVFGASDVLGYNTDLLSWVRSAAERSRTVFPPESVSTPVVEKGTLFLHGGSKIHHDVMKEFIKSAGGKDAKFVCIPSASSFDTFEEPDSYSAEILTELGCNDVTILHTADPLVADQNLKFSEPLLDADAVWIDGGRTFRFMDCYENTRVQELIANVLKRSGVVGGSSAGCQVPSDFLVRGNPTSNQDMTYGGYTRGMGLIKGVIIDAHFLQRGRHEPLLGLMKQHPQMLGIGIDESTALIVKRHEATVIGPNAVSFYDLTAESDGEFAPVILQSGATYDFKLRKSQK